MRWVCVKTGNLRMALITLIGILVVLLIACSVLEKRAPQRSFILEELLIEQETMPSGWEASIPSIPLGYDLCTTDCIAIRFTRTDRDSPEILAEQDVYRYRSTGIARRTFEKLYIPFVEHLGSVNGWTYQSQVAEQSKFGCNNLAGREDVICEWGSQYEEYIVVFQIRLVPNTMSLIEVEQVIKAIDTRMANYLEKPFNETEN